MYKVCGKLTTEEVNRLIDLSDSLDLTVGGGGSRMSDFARTQELIQTEFKFHFWGKWTKATYVVLAPSAQIVAHRDPTPKGIRYHVPLLLNEGCWVFHDGDWQQLLAGTCYVMDPTKLHGAVNWGSFRRMHLIVDAEP